MISTLQDPVKNLNSFCTLMHVAAKVWKANPVNLIDKNMDITNDEVLNLLTSLNRHQVKYLLVGGMAGVFHGHIRTTQDLDLWIKASAPNRENLVNALKENNVAGAGYLKDTQFVFGFTTLRFGNSGFELDLGDDLKLFKQADFDGCYKRSATGNMEGVPFSVIHINDLILEKEKTGRAKDMGDAEALKEISKKRKYKDL